MVEKIILYHKNVNRVWCFYFFNVVGWGGVKARTNLFFKERMEQNQERIKNIWKGKTKSLFLLF